MTPEALNGWLHDYIPLARALAVEVQHTEPHRLRLTAPFGPNRNGHGTFFGGSLATLGILAGWTAVFDGISRAGLKAQIVIQKSECEYPKPLTADVIATATIAPAEWSRFIDTLQKHRRARIRVVTSLGDGGTLTAATHIGHYAAKLEETTA